MRRRPGATAGDDDAHWDNNLRPNRATRRQSRSRKNMYRLQLRS